MLPLFFYELLLNSYVVLIGVKFCFKERNTRSTEIGGKTDGDIVRSLFFAPHMRVLGERFGRAPARKIFGAMFGEIR